MNSSLVKNNIFWIASISLGIFKDEKKQAIKFLLSPRCKQAGKVGVFEVFDSFFFFSRIFIVDHTQIYLF